MNLASELPLVFPRHTHTWTKQPILSPDPLAHPFFDPLAKHDLPIRLSSPAASCKARPFSDTAIKTISWQPRRSPDPPSVLQPHVAKHTYSAKRRPRRSPDPPH